MSMPQDHISESTPLGGTLVNGGATFRVWAPNARAIYLQSNRTSWTEPVYGDPSCESRRLEKNGDYFSGYLAGAKICDEYKYYVFGPTGDTTGGWKRDPRARELDDDMPWPHKNCVLVDPAKFPWHDGDYRTPRFNDLTIYQFHIGTFNSPRGRGGKFLDIIRKIEYLADLGVTAVQPLPVAEFYSTFSKGYNGSDMFSPETDYGVKGVAAQKDFLTEANGLLAKKGIAREYELADTNGSANQLRVIVDLFHVYGIAVIFDVVYNHAGGFQGDDGSVYFFDRQPNGNQNNSLYFTDRDFAGGLVFAYWQAPVRQFLIDNAVMFLQEIHADGFRFDEVSTIKGKGGEAGWNFCRDLTQTLNYVKPEAILIAECWPDDPVVVRPVGAGGAGFDALSSDGLRWAIRKAIGEAVGGANAPVDMDNLAWEISGPGIPNKWRAVISAEDHDIVYRERNPSCPRIAQLAGGGDARSWYARSRSRVAMGLVLTSPGIPHIFMGQEFLEDKQWHDDPDSGNHIWWDGLANDRHMADFHRATRELMRLRRELSGLKGEGINVFHVHNDNRIVAFHRWVEGEGHDVVVVASLNEHTLYDYDLGFPAGGHWQERYNSDVYDNFFNPHAKGNYGGIDASWDGMHGLPARARLTIPANGVLIFTR